MVSVAEASAIIQNNLWTPKAERVDLLSSLNRVLAEDVLADRDFPPYDRVTMDGIAINQDQFLKGLKKFKIAGVQAAGVPQMKLNSPDSCLEVMTGAILPEGCDTVIRYEDLKIENGYAEITIPSIKKGESIHRQGSDTKKSSIVMPKGSVISSAEIPLLASVGIARVSVQSLPHAAVISTGNELVKIEEQPEPHQIRVSNVYALAAALQQHNLLPDFFHIQDEEENIRKTLEKVLSNYDLIILSGGVSKGKFDLIPSMLTAMGISNHFHQVKQRPGKPMWFGTGKGKTVFALPGNPVSTFLCFYKYINPWLTKSLGAEYSVPKVVLDSDFTFDPPLTYFLQVKIRNENGQYKATPIPGGGSGDFVNLRNVDGFIELPLERNLFKKGEVFPFISFRG